MGRGAEWVKIINPNGAVSSVNWREKYNVLRIATNTTLPGYLSHEAVLWHPVINKWIFLPRKCSFEEYDDVRDENKGTNLMLIVSEDFSDISVQTVGPAESDYGFTSIALVPGSSLMIALKVKEQGEIVHTKMTVFDIQGNIVLNPVWIDVANVKFEGVVFLGGQESW